jgi:hypothetical protein
MDSLADRVFAGAIFLRAASPLRPPQPSSAPWRARTRLSSALNPACPGRAHRAFRAFDNLGEPVESLQPGADALGMRRSEHAPAGPADLLRRDELCLRSSRMCFLIPVSDMPKGWQLADAGATEPSCSSTARRVGSARAEKARSTGQILSIELTRALRCADGHRLALAFAGRSSRRPTTDACARARRRDWATCASLLADADGRPRDRGGTGVNLPYYDGVDCCRHRAGAADPPSSGLRRERRRPSFCALPPRICR